MNRVLSFSDFELFSDGNMRSVGKAENLNDALQRANRLSYPFWHGESTGTSRGTASIFQETLRDTAHSGFGYKTKVSDQQVPPALKDIDISAKAFDKVEGERETMAHEVGHCLAGLHTDGGLMGTGEWYDTLHPFAQPIGNVGVPLPPVVGQTGQQPIFSSKLLYKIYRLRRDGP